MRGDVLAIALAAFFTFGCIAIYESREHARAMTPPLAVAAVCLGLFVGLTALAVKPGAVDRKMAVLAVMQK